MLNEHNYPMNIKIMVRKSWVFLGTHKGLTCLFFSPLVPSCGYPLQFCGLRCKTFGGTFGIFQVPDPPIQWYQRFHFRKKLTRFLYHQQFFWLRSPEEMRRCAVKAILALVVDGLVDAEFPSRYFKRTWQDSSNKKMFRVSRLEVPKQLKWEWHLDQLETNMEPENIPLENRETFTQHQFFGFHVCFRGCTVDENYKSLGKFISEKSEIPVASKKSFKFKDSSVLFFFGVNAIIYSRQWLNL